jgi:hypothetical protein
VVRWIKWDSGFRGSGLQVGDRIVAVDGTPVTRPATPEEAQKTVFRMIGGTGEAGVWAEAGRHDGDPLGLTVRRRKAPQGWETIEIVGTIRAERGWRTLLDEAWPRWENRQRTGRRTTALTPVGEAGPGLPPRPGHGLAAEPVRVGGGSRPGEAGGSRRDRRAPRGKVCREQGAIPPGGRWRIGGATT